MVSFLFMLKSSDFAMYQNSGDLKTRVKGLKKIKISKTLTGTVWSSLYKASTYTFSLNLSAKLGHLTKFICWVGLCHSVPNWNFFLEFFFFLKQIIPCEQKWERYILQIPGIFRVSPVTKSWGSQNMHFVYFIDVKQIFHPPLSAFFSPTKLEFKSLVSYLFKRTREVMLTTFSPEINISLIMIPKPLIPGSNHQIPSEGLNRKQLPPGAKVSQE